ncbi:hypothetical protein TNCV_4877631 [Trichonephila clavipes]|nr:hypothetical protein TNCV_4877631 [Trichonephila clavipes]
MTWFHSVAVQSRRVRHHSKRKRWWLGAIGSTRNRHRDTRCSSASRLAIARKDKEARSKGAARVWTVTNEAVGSKSACRMM